MPIPVVDLFAGPGGLGEGFSSFEHPMTGARVFKIGVSIEKDELAWRTLRLRAFYRLLRHGAASDEYYDLLRGRLTDQELLSLRRFRSEADEAAQEAICAELGKTPDSVVDAHIERAIEGRSDWVLIGGPPCQAYSLAGRSRMSGLPDEIREKDPRHTLYKQYLRVISKFQPAVFVMENVTGILSAMHGGSRIFERILEDFSDPRLGARYEIRSFLSSKVGGAQKPADFVIKAERFSIPQARHRVILLGVRSDYGVRSHQPLKPRARLATLEDVLAGLPRIRSRLSYRARDEWGSDSHQNWVRALRGTHSALEGWRHPLLRGVKQVIRDAVSKAGELESPGAKFIEDCSGSLADPELGDWFRDDGKLEGITLHDSRSHIASDLHRYMFMSAYASVSGEVPKLQDLPPLLLPDHKNAASANPPHADRFKVQLWDRPAWTITSHIAKDGHYFVHPDPAQCRSLTVREAARVQTFPDSYFFVGPRTAQYVQVGNAVPPYLAKQLAEVVAGLMQERRSWAGLNESAVKEFEP